MTWNPILH